MLNAFVPCLYREVLFETRVGDAPLWCCNVTELFEVWLIATREPDWMHDQHAHQDTIYDAAIVAPGARLSDEQRRDRQLLLRGRVCRTFYEVMAAREAGMELLRLTCTDEENTLTLRSKSL